MSFYIIKLQKVLATTKLDIVHQIRVMSYLSKNKNKRMKTL